MLQTEACTALPGEASCDAVAYLPGERTRALKLVRAHPRPETLGLRHGLTFFFGWEFEGRRVTGVTAADPPRCAELGPESFDWTRLAEGLWAGRRR